MIIEKNNIDIPANLDDEFFRNVLEDGFRQDDIVVHEIQFTLGCAGGDNYCSNIYRAVVKFSRPGKNPESLSVIIKSMPITEHNDFLLGIQAFMREKVIYFDVIPRLEVLLPGTKFGAKCFYTLSRPVKTIVFEDLQTRGFVNCDRSEGLDEEHCRLILTKLGKFHAASMVLAERQPSIMDHFPTGIFAPAIINCPAFDSVFINNLDFLSKDVVPKWAGYEVIAEKLQNILNDLRQRCFAIAAPRDDEIKVLNHGDLWVNNFMFKYDKEKKKPYDAAFIDFQMSYFSSPGFDLNYFFNTSLQFDILKGKREQLLRIYHQSLESTLNGLGYQSIPTFNDIKNEMHKKEFFGFVTSFSVFPLVAMDKNVSTDNSFETLADEEASLKKRHLMFSSKRFVETMKYSLKRFDEMGVLD